MKTGAIIYVAGDSECERHPSEYGILLEKFGVKADRLEIITRNTGHFDIHDAWWSMLTHGMQQVICMLAEVNSNDEIEITGRQMRLCG